MKFDVTSAQLRVRVRSSVHIKDTGLNFTRAIFGNRKLLLAAKQ